MPATPRTAALGNAWVAGRDQDVLFYNPAQLIGARHGHGSVDHATSVGRHDGDPRVGVYAAGKWSLTLGWGVQIADFSVSPTTPYPYSPDVLVERRRRAAARRPARRRRRHRLQGIPHRRRRASTPPDRGRCRRGVDRTSTASRPISHGVFVADVGVARNIFGGVAAFSVQNLGRRSIFGRDDEDDEASTTPRDRRFLAGWSTGRREAGRPARSRPLHAGARCASGWTAPAAASKWATAGSRATTSRCARARGGRSPAPSSRSRSARAFTVDRAHDRIRRPVLRRRPRRQRGDAPMAMNARARSSSLPRRALAAAGCSQALKLIEGRLGDGPVAADDHRAESRRARAVRGEDAVLRIRHRQAAARVPRRRRDQDEDGGRLAVRDDCRRRRPRRARSSGASI